MDPWKEISVSSSDELSQDSNSNSREFEDNFKPVVSDALPDSQEYLAILENKLNKLKADSNLLQQLTQKREDCMSQLLNNCCSSDTSDYVLETPIENSTILRAFAPEKQALTQGELVELVKYDHLIDEEEDIEKSKEPNNSSD